MDPALRAIEQLLIKDLAQSATQTATQTEATAEEPLSVKEALENLQ